MRGTAERYFFHGDVFIARDRIVASSDVAPAPGVEAGVHAFDRDSGRERWKYPAGRGVLGSVIGAGSRVFAYAADGDLIALTLDSGTREWSYPLRADPWQSPAVLGDRVFGGSNDGSVYALDTRTGRVQWQQKVSSAVTTSLIATAFGVYAGTRDGTMYRLAPGNGEVRASITLDAALRPVSAPRVTGDAVLVLLADQQADYRTLVSLDPALSKVKWRQAAADKWTTSRIFATERTVWIGTPSGEVAAYCLADGSSTWSHKFASAPIRSIGGSDEILYAGTPSGSLFAIRPPKLCM